MRSLSRTSPLFTLLGVSAVVACNHNNNSSPPVELDAGFEAGLNFDASMQDAAPVVDAGKDAPTEAGIVDAALDAAMPVSAGGTGAFGIVTVNGVQKMYLPVQNPNDAGDAAIAVVNVGIAGNGVSGAPALIDEVDLGGTQTATTTGGTSAMIVAATTASDDVWFIDPTTDKVVKHITLAAASGQSSFSGGGGSVTGIATDANLNIAILSVWNGFAIVDLGTQALKTVVQAPPSENFGYDSVKQRILAPFYNCTSSTGLDGGTPSSCNTPMSPSDGGVMQTGLSVIDISVTPPVVYTYEDPNAQDPTNPLGGEPDSASADPTNQIYVVASEADGYENVLDFSKASFDTATLTVTAPHVILQTTEYDGVAIEPSSHLGFLELEGDNTVAVISVVAANAGNQQYVYGTMPNLPNGGGGYTNLLDPHGIAVTTSVLEAGNKPVGFVVDSQLQWVARVDLDTLQSLAESDASVQAGTTQLQSAVTYLDATTKE
jgi:hypothetical protein